MAAKSTKDCFNCGDPFAGEGDLCPDCVPDRSATAPLPPDRHRCLRCGRVIPIDHPYCAPCRGSGESPGTRVVNRLSHALSRAPICPYCRRELDWPFVAKSERRLPDGSVEAMYYCPGCRCILEFANWTEEKMRRTLGGDPA